MTFSHSGHLGLRNPWTNQVEIWHDCLRPAHDPTCQNWFMPHKGYRSSRGEIATSRTFLFLVPRVRLQSTPCNMVGRPIYHKTCVCSKYVPTVSFRSKGLLPSPIYTPKTAFWDHLKLKPMDSVFTFFLATDKAIITKPDQNVKQVKYYIMI